MLRSSARRFLSSSARRQTAWSPQPAPPRLPKEDQEIFEQLQKQSTGAFSTPRQPPKINQSPQSKQEPTSQESTAKSTQTDASSLKADIKKGDELHPHVRRGAAPEFEGDTDPRTGERGGPKNEPIRWGQMEGDWSYNGRVSDF